MKTFRMKESLSYCIDKLYGKGTADKIAFDFLSSTSEDFLVTISRNDHFNDDILYFTKDDFENATVYNPNGWNVAPDVYPDVSYERNLFLIAFDCENPQLATWDGQDFYLFPSKEIFNTSSPFKYKKIDLANIPDIEEIREDKE